MAKQSQDFREWLKPSNLIASIAMVISAIALVTAIKSCQGSNRALEFTSRSFQSERSIILQGMLDHENQKIILKPVDSSMVLQHVQIYYPSPLIIEKHFCDPPKFELSYLPLLQALQDYTLKLHSQNPGLVSDIPNGMIPVIVTSEYTARSELYFDTSLYYIPTVIYVQSTGSPKVVLNGLGFVDRLHEDIDPRKYVDRIWKTKLSDTLK